jgi:hypothetical protein
MEFHQTAESRKIFPERKCHFENLRDSCSYRGPRTGINWEIYLLVDWVAMNMTRIKLGLYLLVDWVAMNSWNRWSLLLRFCWPNLLEKIVPLYSRGWSYYAPPLCCCSIACRGRFGTKGKILLPNLASILRWLWSSRLICSGRTPLWDVAWSADRSLWEYSTCKWMDRPRPKVSFFVINNSIT